MTRIVLSEAEGYALLKNAGIPVPAFSVAKTPEEAVRVADSLGFPVVMKVISPGIIHKSDAGGVITGIRSPDDVRSAFERIVHSALAYDPAVTIDGVMVEQQLAPGLEFIVGGKTDPTFGTLDIGDGDVELEVTGESGVHHLSRAGTWRLPAGKYLIDDITASRNDADGKEWRLIQRVGAGIPSRVSFVIDAGKTLTLKLGSPLVLVPEVTREYEEVHIGLTAVGQAGEHYEPVPCHSDSDGFKMPTVKISNEAGEPLAAATFEYG